MRLIYWDDWNESHIWEHGIDRDEAEHVVNHATAPYPWYQGEGKFVVRGQAADGRYLQVILVYRPSETVDVRFLDFRQRLILEQVSQVTYIIHARELTADEKRLLKRRS
jgi:hypothetical protein